MVALDLNHDYEKGRVFQGFGKLGLYLPIWNLEYTKYSRILKLHSTNGSSWKNDRIGKRKESHIGLGNESYGI